MGKRLVCVVGRLAAVCLVLLAAVVTAELAVGAPVEFQTGLPPALVILGEQQAEGKFTESDLRDEIDRLQNLADWAKDNEPKVGWVEKFLSSKDAARAVSLDDLVHDANTWRGSLVTVEGIYEASEEADGVLRAAKGKCLVTLAEGTPFKGFGDDEIFGQPVKLTGTVELRGTAPVIRVTEVKPARALSLLRLARAYEIAGDDAEAVSAYISAEGALRGQRTNLAAFARVRAGALSTEDKAISKHYNMAWTSYVTNVPAAQPAYQTWVPVKAEKRWEKRSVHDVISKPLNDLNSKSFWYSFVGFFVLICGGNPAWGVLLLAVAVRTIIWPLTRKQLESAAAMKKLQPQMKALQAKHADDKQKFQQEFWQLCQANGVNPLGGCLPLLVQMPILIMVYKGIRLYVVEFDQASFLWVKNLAGPDMILLIAYTLSMIAFQSMTQKMNPQAAMDPQQQQQQKMMTWMMPLMFFFMFKTFPAAFMLYWLGTNIVYFAQQWNYMRKVNGDDESAEPAKKGGGFVGSMARLLSGEPASEEEQEEAEPKKDTDHRSLEEMKRDEKHGGKRKKSKKRR